MADYRATRSIRESARSSVHEAVSLRDDQTVIAKVFDLDDESDEARLRHEFELISQLDVEGVVKPQELRRVGDQLVLILERAPGVTLAAYAEGRALTLAEFWPIAIAIVEILAAVHDAGVIHRDIKPSNILIDPKTKRVCIADFGLSVVLESERQRIYDSEIVAGTLPYISPEQTGRTGHVIDHRSDLYSLGVSFYQLLTARLPFEGLAPLELIHAHLARHPRPPIEHRADLPEPLSRLIMKLLAKAPAHRYHTAAGLAADLRRLQAWVEAGESDAFELGLEDVATTLHLPRQLYGRTREHHQLSRALVEVASAGRRQVVALLGPTGVGKSSLLRALDPAVLALGGYMIRGKFDAYHEQPYDALSQALARFFEQLLTESDARLERWRERLREGMGVLASVLAELCPTFELVVGPLAPAVALAPAEARNRLHLTIDRLSSLICSAGQPIVIVLEDIHWAGPDAIDMLETLARGQRGPLLLAVTLRREAVAADHPLRRLTAEFPRHPQVRMIEIGGLDHEAVTQLLADALPGASGLAPLAEAIVRKTNGVPLVIGQLLSHLVEQGILRPARTGWTWDQARVDAEPIPDDAVAIMQAKLDGLSETGLALLTRAACLGPRFDLRRLARLCQRPQAELVEGLVELERTGLLTRAGTSYRFAHDALREAAQHNLAPELRRRLHWTVGRALLSEPGVSHGEDLFKLVDHLDAGLPGEISEDERVELATLNLRAGRRALDTAAYELAHKYFEHGVATLATRRATIAPEGAAASGYELLFRLQFSSAYCLALSGRRERADAAFGELLEWRLEDRHFAEVIARRVRLLWTESRHDEAIPLGLDALARLGLEVPRAPSQDRARAALTAAWKQFRALDLERFDALPQCSDERDAAIIEIIGQLKYPAYGEHDLYLLLVGLHCLTIHERGTHPNTPQAIAELTPGVCGELEEVGDAVALLELAIEIAEREPTASTLARVVGFNGGLSLHRGRPFAEVVERYTEIYPAALEVGEFEAAAFMGIFALDLQLELGAHLRVLDRRAGAIAAELGRLCPTPMSVLRWLLRGLAQALIGPAADDASDEHEDPTDEDRADDDGDAETWDLEPRAVLTRRASPANYYAALVLRAIVELVRGRYALVFELMLECVEGVEARAFNTWHIPRAGTLLSVARDSLRLRGELPPAADTPEVEAKIAHSLSLLRRWAADAPDNYGHYLALATGLRAAVAGETTTATRELDRAWHDARLRGCRWIEGQAAEQLADLLERESIPSLVVGARQRAWDAYAAWGATAKLDLLRDAQPGQFSTPAPRSTGRSSSAGPSSPAPDLAKVLRRIGAITEELRVDQVIERILDATMTSVGAEHGLLVLDQGGELVLVAAASADAGVELIPDPLLVRDAGARAPVSLLNLVTRTQQTVLLDDARTDLRFAGDPYLEAVAVRSLLAVPLVKGERYLGALVLENRLTTHGFSQTSVEALELIVSQAASTLENAQLYGALRRSEARWRSLVDGAPDFIALLDERGRVVFRNHDSPLLGLDEIGSRAQTGACTPRACGELRGEAVARWREAVAAVLDDGVRREIELVAVDADGQPLRWYAVRLAPIEVHRGVVNEAPQPHHRNAVVVATDISARHHAEQQTLALEAQLRQQQRLESLGTLASGVAHEINNPIQGIMNYAELIQSSAGGSALIEEFAGEITSESERVAAIVRSLLAFSRQDADPGLAAVALDQVVKSSLSLIHTVLRHDHIELLIEVSPELPPVECRAQQLQQVVMNLVTNARDALNERYGDYDERKRITIEVSRDAQPGWLALRVRDLGGGIPKHVLPRIFDPFFTTKGRDQGTGLGLAVSHGIIQDHGGEMDVETEAEVGTCFTIRLPVAHG